MPNDTTQQEEWFRKVKDAYQTGDPDTLRRAGNELTTALPEQAQGILARVGVWAADRALADLEELR